MLVKADIKIITNRSMNNERIQKNDIFQLAKITLKKSKIIKNRSETNAKRLKDWKTYKQINS